MAEDSTPNGEIENWALTSYLVCLGRGQGWQQLQGGGRRENKGGGKRRENLDTKSRDEISLYCPLLVAERTLL